MPRILSVDGRHCGCLRELIETMQLKLKVCVDVGDPGMKLIIVNCMAYSVENGFRVEDIADIICIQSTETYLLVPKITETYLTMI